MALLVHLPLIGDLHNQGLAEITHTGTPVFKTTGKIGNSAFDLSHRVTFNCPSLDGIKTFSIAFWAKVNSDSSLSTNWVDVISFTDRKADGSVTGALRWETCYSGTWGISSHDNSAYNISNLSNFQAVGKDIWHHIIITVDLENNEVKEYQNGIVQKTATCNGGSLTGAFHFGENNLINGEIQDVRIFSHCLSPMEISELKKALVLHYCLDNNGVGNKNISSKYVSCGNGNPDNTNNGGRTKYYGDYGIIIPAVEKADTYFTIWTTESLENGQIYTLSANVSGLIEGTYYIFPLFAQGNSSMGTIRFDHNGRNSLTFTMNYTGTVNTVTVDGKTYYQLFMDDIARDIASGQGEITINNIKLEKGDKATLWCPNSSDALYTALGYDDGIEYDTSGYGNNGTYYIHDSTGDIVYSINSPRYLASTQLLSANSSSSSENGTVYLYGNCSLTNPNQLTIAFWCKAGIGYNNSTGQGQFCTTNGDYGNSSCGTDYLQSAMNHRDSAIDINNSTGDNHLRLPVNFTQDEWHHYAFTYDGQTAKAYKDGVQTSSVAFSSATSLGSFKAFVLGFSRAGGIWRRNTSTYSDARVYVTCLSAEEIQKLYTVSASIDSNGNAYSNAFVE